ncbi:MAG: nucleoside-diphosphate sugar epimerase/dehydratase [Alphaproteobacteria bacterium]|nr:nucleoside-diphosphate sugar epimerase/dehydratase [Alphaproteobacteria bacterium]
MRYRISQNVLAVLHDALMAGVSFVLALYLRLGGRTLAYAESFLFEGLVAFTGTLLVTLLYYRTYRHVWRYTALNDLVTLAKAGTLALLVFYVGMFGLTRLEGMPRSVPFIHWMTLMLCLMAGRVLWRLAHDRALIDRLMGRGSRRIPVLLVGAGPQAEMFIRESERSVDFPYLPVGLVDDDRRQHGREIHHVRVYGGLAETSYILKKLAQKGKVVERIILTDPGLKAQVYKNLLAVAEAAGITLARLPSLSELKAGDRVYDIRPVAVEDILGRPQTQLDRPAMQAFVQGKRVLVTGAGGSIGSELVRQIAASAPLEILLFDISEYQLYLIDQELGQDMPQLPRRAIIGDVRDGDQLAQVFADFKPELVFHAAAIKHVPLSEINPDQAVLTNILGSKQVADACVAHRVAAMVQISTDKAVNPLSVMGASKRAAEIYGQMLAHDGAPTRFTTVRFGNVLNSTGSVVPLFQKQIARGGPVTVTHKDMVRYFMSISEAVQLVLQAAVLGETTDDRAPIFVLDMGEPVRIEDLACQMIRLAGLRPYEDIAIAFTGLRPGEKLFEELFHDGENLMETTHAAIRLARARMPDRLAILAALGDIIHAARAGDKASLRRLLQRLVTDYRPDAAAA